MDLEKALCGRDAEVDPDELEIGIDGGYGSLGDHGQGTRPAIGFECG